MRLKVQNPTTRGSTCGGASQAVRAFTLIELVVVIGIIILLVAIAVPAVGPAMSMNQQTQAIQTLTNAIVTAQTRAENRGGCVIRIERAFKTDARGYMLDANGFTRDQAGFDPNTAPVWLDYQQIRFLNPPKEGRYYQPGMEEPIKLPKNVWLAPDYALQTNAPVSFATKYYVAQVADLPAPAVNGGNVPNSAKVNPFNTFCIAFDQRGNVVQLRNYIAGDNFYYLDTTQPDNSSPPISPQVKHLYNSALGVIVYDHSKFEQLGTNPSIQYDFLTREGRLMYINRFLGMLVEARKQ